MEQHGAVFLPAAGYRNGTTIWSSNPNEPVGYYWAASYAPSTQVNYVNFNNSWFNPQNYHERYYGHCVRLVHAVQ